MSTVKATNLQHASSSSVNAVTTSGGDLTNAAGVSFMGGSKNLLYNGAMNVAQRSTSVAGISGAGVGSYNTADRWNTYIVTAGTWTQSIEADGPTGSGLTQSLKMLCTTANSSLSAGSVLVVRQTLEGQDLQRVGKGTASAQQLTLSFWVKSNVTGTYVARLYDLTNSRIVSATYTVSASATWEKKTIAFPADTTGSLANTNAGALQAGFFLSAGSNFTSGALATSWAADTQANNAAGQTNLAASTNNYWQVTGVQLEVGPVATSFEFKSFGQELRECHRYYQLRPGLAGTSAWTGLINTIQFPVMRSAPTVTTSLSSGTGGAFTAYSDPNNTYGNGAAYQSGANSIHAGCHLKLDAEL